MSSLMSSHDNIVYLDYRTSGLASSTGDQTIVSNSLSNIIKNMTFIAGNTYFGVDPQAGATYQIDK